MNDDDTPAIHQPPAWAVAYFQDCRSLLGISNTWRLWLQEADKPGDFEDTDGYTGLSTRYLKATIVLRRGLSEERGRAVIMHELFHVALAPLDLAMDRIADLIPESLRQHARDLYTDAEEQVIEQLTRALQEGITPPAQPASDGPAESDAGERSASA